MMFKKPATTQLDVLVEARDLISKGWARGALRRDVGDQPHYCLLGAVQNVEGRSSAKDAALNRIQEQILLEVGDQYEYQHMVAGSRDRVVWTYNDTSRDKRRVLRLLDRAIDRAAKRRIR